ncbi:response regulator transcription factor [Alkalihalobacillus deserti]|uniref:response regulator transcription factor n=1 Tax=Alkalihalobacillus deserti TaxID=2879466 RepID=UPI001D147486|nr:response regulator transcription factor [Alkalihalobacillus deserti]
MDKFKVLVVDDEWNMRNLLRVYLTKDGFEVSEAKDGLEALSKIEHNSYDLIILDVMMPGMDGWEVCKKIRLNQNILILMLTARTEIKDKVHGLNIGADDYLVKPFASEELVARVQALLRRTETTKLNEQQSTSIVKQGIKVDLEKREILIMDEFIELTPKEFDLFFTLIDHPGRVYSRERLLEQVWDVDYFGDFRTVDTHVKNVREKVRKAGLTYNPIQTVWGVGYKFKEPNSQ